MVHGQPLSIADLLASGAAPRPHEAVAIVLELCGQVATRPSPPRVMPAISTSTVTLGSGGTVSVAGGVPGEDEQTVFLVGRLLLEMLEHAERVSESAVPPRLKATATRAATGGRTAFPTLADLVSALRRHGPDYETRQAIAGAFERWTRVRAASSTGSSAEDTPANAAPTPDRRKNAPAPDVLRRFLREAEQEAYRARLESAPEPVRAAAREPKPEPAAKPRRFWLRATRALLVGVILLVIAGAGMLFLVTGSIETPPLIVPISKPTPPTQRSEPGWELLRQPERVSLEPTLPPRTRKNAGVEVRREHRDVTAPAAPEPVPGR